MWHDVKQLLKAASGLNDVVLHVVLGMALFLIIATLTRRLGFALVVITSIAIANEAVDLVEDATGTGWLGSVYDVLWTIVVPASFIVLLKYIRLKQVEL